MFLAEGTFKAANLVFSQKNVKHKAITESQIPMINKGDPVPSDQCRFLGYTLDTLYPLSLDMDNDIK